MNKDEMVEFLILCLSQTYQSDKHSLSESTNMSETFGTNSLQRMALLASIENEIDVMISLGDLGKYPTIGDLAEKLMKEMEN